MGVATGSISGGRPVMTSTVMSLAKGDMGQQVLDSKLMGGEPDPAALGFSPYADFLILSYLLTNLNSNAWQFLCATVISVSACRRRAGAHVSPVPFSRHPQPPVPSSSAPHSCLGNRRRRAGTHVRGHFQGNQGSHKGAWLRYQGWNAGRPHGQAVMDVVEVRSSQPFVC